MVLFLMEDHELPLIRGTATIRGGSRDIPAGKAGMAGIYGQSWRTGGTKTKTGDELDELLESRAARVETGADEDSSSISFAPPSSVRRRSIWRRRRPPRPSPAATTTR